MATIIIIVNIILFLTGINPLFRNENSIILFLSLAALLPQAINTQIRHFFLGKKAVFKYNLLMAFETYGLAIVVLALWLSKMISVTYVLIGYLAMNFSSSILHISTVAKMIDWGKIRSSIKLDVIKVNLKNGAAYFFTGMGGFWSHRANYLMLELFRNTKEVGLYTVALAIPNLIANIPNQISLILYPYISAFKEKRDAVNLTSVIVKTSAIAVLLIYLPIIFWGDRIIVLIYGNDYAGLHLPLKILFAAMFLDGIGSLLFNHFAGRGKPIYGSYKFTISISFLVLGGILLIPRYGITGAAFSKLISAGFASAFIAFLFIKENGFINTFMIRSADIALFKKILRQEIE